eukprot:scaffold101130_cov33-Tisochrysis_lutea.AAC.1
MCNVCHHSTCQSQSSALCTHLPAVPSAAPTSCVIPHPCMAACSSGSDGSQMLHCSCGVPQVQCCVAPHNFAAYCSDAALLLTTVQYEEGGGREEAAPHLPRKVGDCQQGGGGSHEGNGCPLLLPLPRAQ